ncbi:MAG: replication-associated recombination protein A, partial [Vicinamibacteria bacterium]
GGDLFSMILWGPPGSGKTTLANAIRRQTRHHFEALSAVMTGVKELREVLANAAHRRKTTSRRTILFIDEIHRYNKSQQDALLPAVESGDVILIGATTENPSFEVVGALLSRCRVVVVKPLSGDAVMDLMRRSLKDKENGLGDLRIEIDENALMFLSEVTDGDARRALGAIEIAASLARSAGRIDLAMAQKALSRKALLYDKSGEEHFNLISALHKSIRNSDADASLYWLARMLEGGEDPLYVARRLVRFASEDVGLADPHSLTLAMAAQQAVHFIGQPEGALALAELVVYLAAAPRSNAVYAAWNEARKDALETRADPPPAAIRNAPTKLMKSLGYGEGYKYAHDEAEGVAAMECLPDSLKGRTYYKPTTRGREKEIGERLAASKAIRVSKERDVE